MSNSTSIKIEGLSELQSKFESLTRRAQGNVLRRAARVGSKIVRDEARARAPVQSGNLRRNISVSVRLNRTSVNADIGMKPRAWYGSFVELGTRNMAARPFLRPALAAKKDEVLAAIAAEIRDEIEQAASGA